MRVASSETSSARGPSDGNATCKAGLGGTGQGRDGGGGEGGFILRVESEASIGEGEEEGEGVGSDLGVDVSISISLNGCSGSLVSRGLPVCVLIYLDQHLAARLCPPPPTPALSSTPLAKSQVQHTFYGLSGGRHAVEAVPCDVSGEVFLEGGATLEVYIGRGAGEGRGVEEEEGHAAVGDSIRGEFDDVGAGGSEASIGKWRRSKRIEYQ